MSVRSTGPQWKPNAPTSTPRSTVSSPPRDTVFAAGPASMPEASGWPATPRRSAATPRWKSTSTTWHASHCSAWRAWSLSDRERAQLPFAHLRARQVRFNGLSDKIAERRHENALRFGFSRSRRSLKHVRESHEPPIAPARAAFGRTDDAGVVSSRLPSMRSCAAHRQAAPASRRRSLASIHASRSKRAYNTLDPNL